MLVVAGLSLKNLQPRVWDKNSSYYLPDLRAVMVSYGEFHQLRARRKQAMKVGLRKYLDVSYRPHVKVYLDNGAFYFLRQQTETDAKQYREFVRKANPDWYPIPFDSIPTPQMCDDSQRSCFNRTMEINRWHHRDGYTPVIHVSRLLKDYIACIKRNESLAHKKHIALGGIVPNLLRTPKAISYTNILETLELVRREFKSKQLHVFGIGGTATLHLAKLLGMDSVDSSGWRNRAARGIVQLPGCGDRMVNKMGSWRGREPSDDEWDVLRSCQCPPCRLSPVRALKKTGLKGFCNRATHNLYVLLEEARWLDEQFTAKTYAKNYMKHLDNTVYLPIIEKLVEDIFGKKKPAKASTGAGSRGTPTG